jgi:hypothetical protein
MRDALGEISLPALPSLGRRVSIPVYVIHNSDDAEDYFFIFDFEDFVERSREGVFVRPVLKLWTGRDDFDRATFARQFRESFAREFDAARMALNADDGNTGWFGWLAGVKEDVVGGVLGSFVSNVVLLVALSAGRMVLSQVLPAGLLNGKSDARKLEDSIEATKAKVDQALEGMNLVLHRDLTRHAFYGAVPDHLSGAAFDDWPLPDFVARHLDIA